MRNWFFPKLFQRQYEKNTIDYDKKNKRNFGKVVVEDEQHKILKDLPKKFEDIYKKKIEKEEREKRVEFMREKINKESKDGK